MGIHKEQLKRISEMEKILDEQNLKVAALRSALDEFAPSLKRYEKLKDYYSGNGWRDDVESYERGEVPKELKCGVLSEDAVYDLIGDTFDLAVDMLELATKIIKSH